jgi:predicted transcriptional regulator
MRKFHKCFSAIENKKRHVEVVYVRACRSPISFSVNKTNTKTKKVESFNCLLEEKRVKRDLQLIRWKIRQQPEKGLHWISDKVTVDDSHI